MYNEIKINGLKQTDRVFECDCHLVKVRLEKKEIIQAGKIFGPSAISLKFTASVCNKKGKAISRSDGRYCILPKTVTVPVMEPAAEEKFGTGLEQILKPLILEAVKWHTAIDKAEDFVKAWEKPQVTKVKKIAKKT